MMTCLITLIYNKLFQNAFIKRPILFPNILINPINFMKPSLNNLKVPLSITSSKINKSFIPNLKSFMSCHLKIVIPHSLPQNMLLLQQISKSHITIGIIIKSRRMSSYFKIPINLILGSSNYLPTILIKFSIGFIKTGGFYMKPCL